MNQRPVFLFAFSNDKEFELNLQEELNKTSDILGGSQFEDRFIYKNIGGPSLDTIYKTFNDYHDRIALFHYAGHSDEKFLHLQDTEARASSLGVLMGMQQNLELVFLNGCDNEGQVEELHANGVRVIIATEVPIADERALKFCEAFYDALAGGKTIQQAFDTAESLLKNESIPTGQKVRGRRKRNIETTPPFEWKLHLKEGHNADWKIPDPLNVAPAQISKEVPIESEELNFRLFNYIFQENGEGIGLHHVLKEDEKEAIAAYQDSRDTEELTPYYSALHEHIMDAFPSILSVQVNDLFTENATTDGRIRLNEIKEAYITLGRLLHSIALSTLWDTALDPKTQSLKDGFTLLPDEKESILDFLNPSSFTKAPDHDYFFQTIAINRILKHAKNKEFELLVPEIVTLFQNLAKEQEYYSAYQYLKQNVLGPIQTGTLSDEDIEERYIRSEEDLGLLLAKCCFFHTYELVTVKDVLVEHPRQELTPNFAHHRSILKGIRGTKKLKPFARVKPINNNSLYLTKDFQTEERPLNLSPFLIDENSFLDAKNSDSDIPKIAFFMGWEEQAQTLHYVQASEPDNFIEIKKGIPERFKNSRDPKKEWIVEYYTFEDGQKKPGKNPDRDEYKQPDIELLFQQFKLFKNLLES